LTVPYIFVLIFRQNFWVPAAPKTPNSYFLTPNFPSSLPPCYQVLGLSLQGFAGGIQGLGVLGGHFFGLFVAMLLSSCSQFEMTAEPGKAISKILGVVLGLSLIPLGNILPKVKRNGVFGLRTKWSMANDTCWNLCQRAGGVGLALTGILIVISSLLISSPILQSIAMLVLIVGDSIASVILSYQIWKKHGKPPCA